MTGRERLEQAFAPAGTPDIGAVICYEGIYHRDHWRQLTSCPWWYQMEPDPDRQKAWQRDMIRSTDQDWFLVHPFYSHEERARTALEVRGDEVLRLDRRTGREERLEAPQVGGWSVSGRVQSYHPTRLATTREEIDAMFPVPGPLDPAVYRAEGRAEIADAMRAEFPDRCPLGYVGTPLWHCYSVWGFEGLMTRVADQPDLVRYATERILARSLNTIRTAAALGARLVWIEECLTDMIHPDVFQALNVPLVRRMGEEIRAHGMFGIYYYCGNPWDRLGHILDTGADAVSFEESKKHFTIDIEAVVDAVRGRAVVFGNLDAMVLLAMGSDRDLRAEIARQVRAGRRNRSRFIVSLGSPVTPSTSVERVRRYCAMAREEGRGAA